MTETDQDIWCQLTDTLRQGFSASGYCAGDADRCAEVAVSTLHAAFAGQRLGYLPKKRLTQRAQYEQDLRALQPAKVCDRWGVSRATVYRDMRRKLTNIR